MRRRLDGERYPIKAGIYSSHNQLVRLMGPGGGRGVLDVGCAQGELAAELQAAGWSVLGIEPDPVDAEGARARGVDVLEGTLSVRATDLAGRSFDAVLFADVLEHMSNPEEALVQAKTLLKPRGVVVASIPNIAHLAVRAQLMAGAFTYSDRGPLDRTHLRFFTRRTARQLFIDSGYQVVAMLETPAPIELAATAIGIPQVPAAVQRLNWLSSALWPGGLAYQFLVLARPDSAVHGGEPLPA